MLQNGWVLVPSITTFLNFLLKLLLHFIHHVLFKDDLPLGDLGGLLLGWTASPTFG